MTRILISMTFLASLSACSGGSDAAGQPPVEIQTGLYSFTVSGAGSESTCLSSSDMESTIKRIVEKWAGDENVPASCSLEGFKLTGNAFSGRAICSASPAKITYNFTGDRSSERVNLDGQFKHSVYADAEGAATQDMVGEEISFDAPLKIAATRQGNCP